MLERALKKSGCAARERLRRNVQPTLLLVDAQSVKNTDTAARKGYDAGKKVSGIKRHIGVDTQGLPHAVAVTIAEVTDRKGAPQAMRRCKANLGKFTTTSRGNQGPGFQWIFTHGIRTQFLSRNAKARACPLLQLYAEAG